ncbi:MAG: hypothetical protein HOP12_10935 [Candidatus Eisenbacteria bacterium]|uniref:Damage-inducible protein DinB n=1 Tax=Eiseniibacteriota bacterium TaxID=2212470 RepID=A0A849SFZ0_UNCEI|nr:hypothetical protein [Candidatus Eisenbacteria bacterium]
MMNRETFLTLWDNLRQRHGITLRLIDALPADRIDSNPIPNMRTPKQLLFHLYGQLVREVAKGVVSGEVLDTPDEAISALKTKDDLVRFVNQCWVDADRAAQSVTDAQLGRMMKTPWGSEMPGAMAWTVLNDEFLHHRGQLFAYVRALGHDVPMMWDFAHNAPEYQPKAHAKG